MKTKNKIFSLSLLPALMFASGLQAMEEKEMAKKVYPPEFLEAITLQSDLDNGKKLYRGCVSCHRAVGETAESAPTPALT